METASPELVHLLKLAHNLLGDIPASRQEMVASGSDWCGQYQKILDDNNQENTVIRKFIADNIVHDVAGCDMVLPGWAIDLTYNTITMIDEEIKRHQK